MSYPEFWEAVEGSLKAPPSGLDSKSSASGRAGNVILDTRIWAVTYSAPFHRAGPPDQGRLLGALRRKRRGTHARREESAAAVQVTCKHMPNRMRDTHS
jgi:hypothetical protein